MMKRVLAAATLVCAVPGLASAWTLNTWAKSRGGSITVTRAVTGAAASQTSGNGSLFYNYTTSATNPTREVDVNIANSSGYSVNKVWLDGVLLATPATSFAFTDGLKHSVYATFQASTISVTATAGKGGRVTPASVANMLYGQTLLRDLKFTITPDPGYTVNQITLPPRLTQIPLSSGQLIVTIPKGYIFNQGSIALNVTFTGVAASAGATQNVQLPASQAVTLDGTGSVGATSYLWSQVSGPVTSTGMAKVTINNPTSVRPTFTPTVAGTYIFQLAINGVVTTPGQTGYVGGSPLVSSVTVNVFTSETATAKNLCTSCHSSAGVGAGIYANWSSSLHSRSTATICSGCHVGSDTGSHPGTIASCISCHIGVDTASKALPGVHFASVTTNTTTFKGASAAYVGNIGRPRNECTECHFKYDHSDTGFANNSAAHVLAPWAGSAHGALTSNWTSNLDDHMFNISDLIPGTSAARSTTTINISNAGGNYCVRCHTSRGIAQFVTADANHAVFTNISAVDIQYGFGIYSDSSPLICSGCHAPGTNGYTYIARRQVPAAVGFYNVSTNLGKVVTNHQFPDLGESNICVSCHAGATGNGEAIKNVFAKYNYTGSLINPHHGMAADSVTSYGLYEFGDYGALTNDHMSAGSTGQGPCVGCHFTSSQGHSLDAIDANGNAIASVCVNCHGANFNVNAAKANFDASLVVLKNALVAKGLPTKRAAANWGTGLTGAKNMGASMNYYVLYSARAASNPSGGVDPAGYVHNPNYVKRVIFDSIDWVANGALTGSISNVIASQQANGQITAAQAASASSALVLAGSTSAQTNSGVCADCHAGATDPVSNNNIVAEYAASGHATNPSGHGPSCTTCHSSAAGDPTHPVNGPMSKNYLNVEANCLNCHNGGHSRDFDGINHYANTPNAAFSNISASAFVGYNGKGINPCSNCHFGFDGHGIGATTTQTFTTNSDVLAAWMGSAHGQRTGTAWTPGTGASGHDWRNSGSAANFQTTVPANDCVRCHTSDGFAQFVGSTFTNVNNVGAKDGNRYNSPLSCSACHLTDATGSATAARNAAVKNAGSVGIATFYNISTVDKTSKATMKSRIAGNFPDVGESNLCISCHSGRVAGPNLADLAATGHWDLSNTSFQNSHYMAAAGTMYMKGGFKNFTTLTAPAPSNNEGAPFASSKNYNQTLSADTASTPDGVTGGQSSSHRRLGTPAIIGSETYLPAGTNAINSNGPCVTCHMKAYNPIAGNGFTPPSAGRPAAGHSLKIDDATAQELCLQCHADAPHLDGGDGQGNAKYTPMSTLADMQSAMLDPQSECLQNGLTLVKQLLQIKYMIKFDPTLYPYFYDLQQDATGKTAVTDWTRKKVAGVSDPAVAALGSSVTVIPAGGLSQVQAYRLMGACFNLNLLARDPGAYVHARTYSQRLVYDTIDFLDDNQMNFSSLTTARAFTAANVSGLTGVYLGTNVNVFASDGTLATESMAWLAGTHYTDTSSGNTLAPLKLRP